MSLFDRLPRRTPKPVPKHAAPSIARLPMPGSPTGDVHIMVPAPEQPPAVRTGPRFTWPEPPAPAEDPEMTQALAPLRATLAEAAETAAKPDDINILARTLDGLRNLPATPPVAWLRFIHDDGRPSHEEPLSGYPFFAGTRKTSDGRLVHGLCIGENKNGHFVLDEMSIARLDCLIAAATEMRDYKTAAREQASEAAEGTEAA